MVKYLRPYFFVTLVLALGFSLGSGQVSAYAGDFHFYLASAEMVEVLNTLNQEGFSRENLQEITSKTAIKKLNEAGMSSAFALSFAYLLGMAELENPQEYSDVKRENNFLALEVAREPDRLIGFFSVNPLSPYSLIEISRCVKLLNLPGLKLHFTNSNVNLRNEVHLAQVKKVLRHAAELEVPVIVNFRSRSPEFGGIDAEIFVNEILAKIPDLRVQIAHLGGGGGFDRATEEFFRTFVRAFAENPELDKSRIFMDISGVIIDERLASEGELPATSLLERWKVAEVIREWGLEQTVFGSGWPSISPEEYIEVIREKLPLTQWEITTILNNDPVQSLFGEEYAKPNLNILKLFLQDGVDYNVPFSVKF